MSPLPPLLSDIAPSSPPPITMNTYLHSIEGYLPWAGGGVDQHSEHIMAVWCRRHLDMPGGKRGSTVAETNIQQNDLKRG